jgi:cytochrome c-type biogenesis protein CcmH
MIFWITAAALALAVSAILALTVLRAKATRAHPAEYDLRVYRDQLKEVERDLARGIIGADDAERIRTEVGRRVLAADAQLRNAETGASQPRSATLAVSASIALALLGGAAVLYPVLGQPGARDLPLQTRIDASDQMRANRPSQSEAEARQPARLPNPAPDAKFAELMQKLRQTVADRPDDLEGHQLLARNEASLGNYADSYAAQSDVIRLKGAEASAADYGMLAEMMIRAANGYVSPEAEDALKKALNRDPRFPPARYFTALMMAQNDRPDIAFRLMDRLLSDSTPDAPWVPAIRGQIEELAWRAGVRYSLPELAAMPRPSASDMANAAEMSPEDRQEMIRGMVDQLSERLATEGGSAEEWARLISALGVLDQTERARAIWAEAQQVFGDRPDQLAIVRQGAARAGLAETTPSETLAVPAPVLPGPTQQDIENASEMSSEERQEMIQAMVSRLAERLTSEGGSAEEWARLLTSQATLGDRAAAQQTLGLAEAAHGNDPAAIATIHTAARAAGLVE